MAVRKLVELYRFRSLLANLVLTELKLRYRRSVLGFLWSFLNPLLMMGVITLVFSTVMRFNTKDYAVQLLSGLAPWLFVSQAVNLSLMSVVGKGPLLSKVYIPKMVIPISTVLATFVNFALSLVSLLGIGLFIGHEPSLAMLFLPIAILLLGFFVLGLAFAFSCLNVFFRDFGHMTEVLLQAWFYASPIIYTVQMVPEKYQSAFAWNPMTYLIDCFRLPIFEGRLPTLQTIGVAAMASLGALVLGCVVFIRHERHFVMKV